MKVQKSQGINSSKELSVRRESNSSRQRSEQFVQRAHTRSRTVKGGLEPHAVVDEQKVARRAGADEASKRTVRRRRRRVSQRKSIQPNNLDR